MDSISILPKNEKQFTVEVEGDMTKQIYRGDFVCICVPTLKQKADMSIMEARLNADLATLDAGARSLHAMIAQTSVRLISSPDWWLASDGGRHLLDLSVMIEVFSKCIQAQNDWLKGVWKKEEKIEVKVDEPKKG